MKRLNKKERSEDGDGGEVWSGQLSDQIDVVISVVLSDDKEATELCNKSLQGVFAQGERSFA